MGTETDVVELSTFLRSRIPELLGAAAGDEQRIADAIVQHIKQVGLGGPGAIISHDQHETFLTIPLDSGSKVSCTVFFEVTAQGRRVIKRIARSKR